jgi:AbrB family looped-hinge helix DNA binding protein
MTAFRGRIVSGGRLQIPADVRKELGFADGDNVRLEVVDGELRVRSYQVVIKAIQAEVRKYIPAGVSLADELIADRRVEASRE